MKYVKEESNSEDIIKLKVKIEEENKVEDILMKQIKKINKECECLEEEVVCLKKKLEKSQTELNMNIQQIKGYEKLDVILNAQRSPLIKIGLGYEGESSKSNAEDKITISFVKLLGERMTTHFNLRTKV